VVFEQYPIADEAQLDQAVAAAKAAFPGWAKRSYADRGALLHRLADALEENVGEMAVLLTREQGKPLALARQEVGASIAFLRFSATQDPPHTTVRGNGIELVVETRTPLGVVAVIAPWNYPVLSLMTKIAPALFSGNTVVASPASTTPLTALSLAEHVLSVLPAGVMNVITDKNDLGEKLARHSDVAKITFTGSARTGMHVLQSASASLKRVTLELGGNDVAIVLDDADIGEVTPKIFMAAMLNNGQACHATKRVYAPRPMYDRLCDGLATLAKRAVLGNGMDASTQFGPIQNRAQYERVKIMIEDSRCKGRIIAGGRLADRPGYFIAPTVVRDLADDARLVQEEQFGPVMLVFAYDDIGELMERLNSSECGLGGTIWAKNTMRALQIARKIDTGRMWVNSSMNINFKSPLGAITQSGFDLRLGRQELDDFTQLKIISVSR
jgi:acyl-CoA reductase-like NAD-dependent aldehyde dehydrogenase